MLEFAGDRFVIQAEEDTTLAAVGSISPQCQILSLKKGEVAEIVRVAPGMRVVIAAPGLQGKGGEEASVGQLYKTIPTQATPTPLISLDWIGKREVRFIPELQTTAFTATLSHLMSRAGMRANSPLSGAPGLELSEPSTPGLIQLTPDGTVIVIGPDGPTIGGYARLGTVISADRPVLAQLPPGASVFFQPASVDEAVALYREHSAQLTQICDNLRRGKV